MLKCQRPIQNHTWIWHLVAVRYVNCILLVTYLSFFSTFLHAFKVHRIKLSIIPLYNTTVDGRRQVGHLRRPFRGVIWGRLGAVAPPLPQGKSKKRKKKKERKKKEKKREEREKRKKGTTYMNNVKILHIKWCFTKFSIVRWDWKIKKYLAPQKKLKWHPCGPSRSQLQKISSKFLTLIGSWKKTYVNGKGGGEWPED